MRATMFESIAVLVASAGLASSAVGAGFPVHPDGDLPEMSAVQSARAAAIRFAET